MAVTVTLWRTVVNSENDYRTWPEIPSGLKYVDIRLPGTFRELIANKRFSNDEIGRIVRCIALDTDFFVTPKIEPEVFYYRRHQKVKEGVRSRVAKCRKRKQERISGVRKSGNEDVTVTADVVVDNVDTSSVSKTPPISKEKTPPIIPLEKKGSSLLEIVHRRKKPKSKGERLADAIQKDLFSFGLPESQETGQGCRAERSDEKKDTGIGQDIESDPRPVSVAPDTRDDAAWIPERFAVFWAKYPKKVAKGAAVKAFTKLIKSQRDVDKFMKTLIGSLEWWKSQQQWTKDGGKFIPNPATWLNRGNWEDINDNNDSSPGNAEFLAGDAESDAELIRRMRGES